jgi:glucosamine--fructose-6-phosphate aminotransferase (isomerizing)
MIASEKLKFWTKSFRSLIRNTRILIGCPPQKVQGPAIILFPLEPATLCCGLAGILTVKGASMAPDDIQAAIRRILEGLQPMKEQNIQALNSGSIPLDSYLGGSRHLDSLGNALLDLKQDAAAEHLFFSEKETAALR